MADQFVDGQAADGQAAGEQAMADEARHDLARAVALEPPDRYRVALSVAVRAAALVLAERTHPSTIRRGPTGIWVLLARHTPSLREWADFFVLAATRTFGSRQPPVSEREADDLLRDAGRFLDVAVNWSNPYRSNPYRSNPYRSNPYRSNPYRSVV